MATGVTRRGFVAGLATSALGAATLGALSGCGGQRQNGEQRSALADGTYTSAQETPYAKVNISCEFKNSALTNVSYEVTQSSLSDYFPVYENALKDYCETVSETGTIENVDAVTGATFCMTSINDGICDCTLQAAGIDSASLSIKQLNPQNDGYTAFDSDCAEVFSPIKLGTMELANRFVKSAGSSPWKDASGSSIPVCAELFGTMADNGVSLNLVAGGALSGTGILPHALEVEGSVDEAVAKVSPLVERVHEADGKIGFQMCYGGLAPSVPDSVINDTTIAELDQFIEDVGISAARGKQAGFDCIEIKGASADALNGFLSRRVNKREDEYGPQSIENRTRLFCRMIQKVKEVNGSDFPVGALINGCEENDQNLGNNDLFMTVEEAQQIAQALEAAGADWIQVRVGGIGEMNIWAPDVQHIVRKADGLTGYGNIFDYSKHFCGSVDGSRSGFASFLPLVKAIKSVVSVPVGCAAYMDFRLGPDYINEAVKNGDIDIVFMNRPLNCDPELIAKMKDGRREDVTPCMKCMHCHDNIGSNKKYPSSCRMNATSFNSLTDVMPEGAAPAPADTPRNIMVIGGGPAGIECARVAAQRGHAVDLYDNETKLGGLMQFAKGVKGDHEHFEDYFVYAQRQLENNGVNVHLGTMVDATMVEEQNPDVVVVAAGGIRENAYQADGALDPKDAFGSAALGQTIVVLGGSVQAIDFAAYLATEGKTAVIVNPESEDELDRGQSGWFRSYVLPYLRAKGVKIWNDATIETVSATEVEITAASGAQISIPCDSVVDFSDMMPNTTLADEIEAAGYEVYSIGDAAEPFNIQRAVLSGNLCARSL